MQENTEKSEEVYADVYPEKRDWKAHLLCMLEQGGEYDMGPFKRVIMDWTRDQRSRHPVRTETNSVTLQKRIDIQLDCLE